MIITDFNEIFELWKDSVGSGRTPNPKNYAHQICLSEVLVRCGWSYKVVDGIIDNLNEIDIVKNKKSGNIYPVKTHNPNTQDLVKKDASPEDIKKAEKGEEPEKVILSDWKLLLSIVIWLITFLLIFYLDLELFNNVV